MKNKKKALIFFLVLFVSLLFYISETRLFFYDSFVFIKGFFVNPNNVGAIVPSSDFLAEAMVKHIKNSGRQIRILEVGAGTGVMTKKILDKISKDDLLDVVELDSNFCKILKEKFSKKKSVNVNCRSILNWNPDYKYDFIISGLPFNAFKYELVTKILEKYKKLIKKGGILSYFEYIALPQIRLFFLGKNKKMEYSKTLTVTATFRKEYEFDSDRVFINVPPAAVHHLCIK